MRRFVRRIIRLLTVVLLLLCGLLFFFRIKYHSAIMELAETQVRNSTSDLINDAIDKQIELGIIQYDRMVYFEKDLNGKITALKTNMSEVNRLKTDILDLINDEILALDNTDLGIPIGSLILPEVFSGKGIPSPQFALLKKLSRQLSESFIVLFCMMIVVFSSRRMARSISQNLRSGSMSDTLGGIITIPSAPLFFMAFSKVSLSVLPI